MRLLSWRCAPHEESGAFFVQSSKTGAASDCIVFISVYLIYKIVV
jgi:hypothetical protein